jgi:hypothetical protein
MATHPPPSRDDVGPVRSDRSIGRRLLVSLARLPRTISLRTTLLFVAFLGLGIAAVRLSDRADRAEREVRKLRQEAGFLSVDDRKKLHAIALDTTEPGTWRWRVFLPKGHHYQMHAAFGDIPVEGVLPEGTYSGRSGQLTGQSDVEVLITAVLRIEPDRSWRLSTHEKIVGVQAESSSGSKGSQFQPGKPSNTGGTESDILGTSGQVTLDSRGPIVLLRYRFLKDSGGGSFRSTKGKTPGFLIWLDHQ